MHVRLGVVGCGAIATAVHVRNARRIPGAVVTALADPDPVALERAGRLVPSAARLSSCEEVVERSDVDAVVVATPSATHATLAQCVLAAGRHLYLEKPVGVSPGDADCVAAAARDAGVIAAVGFNRRFHPAVIAARRRLRAGEIGAVVRAHGTFEEPIPAGSVPRWKGARESGGGAPLDLGSHHVDLVRHLLGVELQAVASELRSVRSALDDCTLRFEAGECDVTIDCSFVRGRRDTLELTDEDGRVLAIDRYAPSVTVAGRPARDPALLAGRGWRIMRRHADPSYRPSLRAFVDRIRGAEVELATIDDGVASLRAILAAERAPSVAFPVPTSD